MFVKYAPKHPHTKFVPVVNGISVSAGSVILNPGMNEVSDEDWEKIKASLASDIADGTVKPFSVGVKKAGNTIKAKTLKDVPVAVAAKIVAGCSSKDTLRAWFGSNLPDDIALLVVRRMRTLNMDVDEIAGAGEELSDSDIIDEGATGETVTETDGSEESGKAEEKSTGGTASPSYDEMSYKELQSAAKEQGIDPTQKKDALLAALKGEGVPSEDGSEESGDSIPDFDDPNAKVS